MSEVANSSAGEPESGKSVEELIEAVRRKMEADGTLKNSLVYMDRPSERLVPETPFEEEDEGPAEPVADQEGVPTSIRQLHEILAESGREATITRRKTPENEVVELSFSLPAGRDERSVVVDSTGAQAFLSDQNALAWRSLAVYDGIWNESTSTIEVAIRRERFGLPPKFLLRRLGNREDEEPNSLELLDQSNESRLVLGEPSPLGIAVLGRGPGGRPRSALTLRYEGKAVTTTDEADDLIERLSDALFFDIEVNLGVSLVLGRLESDSIPRRSKVTSRNRPSFPANRYPHAPLLLYRLGRDRTLPPVIRYWALYQVLEYFYPKYANEEALRRLSRHLRSPSFDAHRDDDIVKAIALVGRSTNAGERDDLLSTLEAITSQAELRNLITDLEITEQLRRAGRELSVEEVHQDAEDIVSQVARRVYDIRCKIVHSKSSSPNEVGPGLLAGTVHDDLIQPELPLMEYLAEQAIIAAAEPLR